MPHGADYQSSRDKNNDDSIPLRDLLSRYTQYPSLIVGFSKGIKQLLTLLVPLMCIYFKFLF